MKGRPIVAKDIYGKWYLFPFHLLDRIDGEYYLIMTPSETITEKRIILSKFGHMFEQLRNYSPTTNIGFYRFKLKTAYPPN